MASRTKSSADHAVMRELNRSLVVDVLKHEGPTSRAAIARSTALTKPTVSAIIDDLLAAGLVHEIGTGRTTIEGGRPPMLLEFNARSEFFVGIHVGVRRTTVVVTDAIGVEQARRVRATPRSAARRTLGIIAGEVERALDQAEAPLGCVAGVGVCVPGLVDLDQGRCLLAPNLGWRDVAVTEHLQEGLGTLPVHVHNTAQACAVAEALEGAAAGASEVVLLYAGTGVGAGLVTSGQLHRGIGGIAGEIGHTPVPGADGACSCGGRGCLETVVSAPATLAAAAEAGVGSDLQLEQLIEAAATDERAHKVLTEAGRSLGLAAAWLVNVLNPEVLVVGGALVDAGDVVLDPVHEAVALHALDQASADVVVRPWQLGQDAKVRGAVLVAMQQAEQSVRLLLGSP